MSEAARAALSYAAVAWPVFPLHSINNGTCTCGLADCSSPGKHPRTRNGLKDSSTDPSLIEHWWTQWPGANLGIRTGAIANIVVLDIDPRHGGDDSLAEFEHEHGALPQTVESLTGGGGRHLIFKHPGGTVRNRTNLLIGIDVRADGGYIVAPPSTHISGGRYRWRGGCGPDDIAPVLIPGTLLDLLTAGRNPADAVVSLPTNTDDELLRAAQHYVARCDQATEGSRNNAAFKIAGHLFSFTTDDGDRLTEAQVTNLLRPWNDRNQPPLADRELAQTVASAAVNGTARPVHVVNGGRRSSQEPANPDSLDDWPDPQPLPDELPPVAPFDPKLLPISLRPWVEDIAERVQCPPDFPAVAVMIALATVVGRKLGIRPKRQDDWLVVPNLFGLVVGPPSVMKTPALAQPLLPLTRLEIEAKRVYEEQMREFKAAQLVAEQRKQEARGEIRRALKAGENAMGIAREVVDGEEEPPTRQRYVVNDPTVEKLGEILRENPNGVLLYRDEMIGFLKSLEKDGHESARAFYLEAWNGTGRYTYDRIGRGTIDIEAAIISIIGSIQPGPLRAYLLGAVKNEEGADGLVQRFQLAVYPDVSKAWRNVDRWPDSDARRAAFDLICGLDTVGAGQLRAERDTQDSQGIPFLRLDSAAQRRFDAWRLELETLLRSDTEHPVIVQHLAKYRSLIPSLALLIFLAEGGAGPVGESALNRAIGWGEYLLSHARRIYSIAISPDTAEGMALAKKIMSGALPDAFALRDIYRHCWIGLATRDAATRAADVLVDLDWLAVSVEETGGRPRTRYSVNPKLRRTRSGEPPKPTEAGCAPLLAALSVPSEGESHGAASEQTANTPADQRSGRNRRNSVMNTGPHHPPEPGQEVGEGALNSSATCRSV